MITLGILNAASGVRHGFFTRNGGVSGGLYASLNCGLASGDLPEAVATNRVRVMRHLDLPPSSLLTLRQVHGNRVITVARPWETAEPPEADGLVTTTPGLALGILSADCAPVLLADAAAGVIGACHAGWKGARAGIVAATVAAMVARGARPERLIAAVGPCIAQRSYEVGADFAAAFLAESSQHARLFAPAGRPGHALFDLRAYVAWTLEQAGVSAISCCPNDTFAEEERFFSYRRATVRQEPDYGRGISVIVLGT